VIARRSPAPPGVQGEAEAISFLAVFDFSL
jgi:hypothetical protein